MLVVLTYLNLQILEIAGSNLHIGMEVSDIKKFMQTSTVLPLLLVCLTELYLETMAVFFILIMEVQILIHGIAVIMSHNFIKVQLTKIFPRKFYWLEHRIMDPN